MTTELSVLIVEDTPMAQTLCKMVIAKIPHATSDIAEDGKIALDKYKVGNYNLILMDVGLPYLSGIDTTIAIRRYEKENNLAPTLIVALTANKEADVKEKCLLSGMNDYMTKPFSLEKADYIINKFMR
jgi:CheY-like chemotaxis protein